MGLLTGQTIVQSDFSQTSTGVANIVPKTNAQGKIDGSFLKFGGTGSDGALNVSSGTNTIDLAGASFVVKNYTSISITGIASISFINPNTNGTQIIFNSQGAVTITSSTVPAIDLRNLGGSGGSGASSFNVNNTSGSGGGGGSGLGGNGTNGGGGTSAQPTGSSGGAYSPTMIGLNQTAATGGGNATAGVGSTITGGNTSSIPYYKLYNIPGSGGGGGQGAGSGGSTQNGANGGRGGGALSIFCGGALNITSTINASGANGSSSGNNAGGGGGGGGGSIVILYNSLTANTGTYMKGQIEF